MFRVLERRRTDKRLWTERWQVAATARECNFDVSLAQSV
jgi:hypothetical protein